MKAIIVSLKFNPGHFSHLVANYKLFMDSGFTPYMFVNRLFNQMDERNEFHKINYIKELKALKKIDTAVFWFPSLRNIFEIMRLRIFFKSKIIYIYHEPFDSIINYYKSGFRFKKILKICLIHLVNIPTIMLSDSIVLPSEASFSLFKKKYTYLNNNITMIPLLFDDEATGLLPGNNHKRFISYIGTVAADHAFDKFVDFVDSALKMDWFPDQQYLIATSSIIPMREKIILEPHIRSGKVMISEGHPMTNTEINSFFNDSILVWNAYNRSMQSGILPKAFMFGAAVIVLFRNSNEFIDDRRTGILIKDNNNIDEIRKAVDEIIEQSDFYFENCRNKFADCFYYKNKINQFISLLNCKSKSNTKL
jgi:hypothetical protein